MSDVEKRITAKMILDSSGFNSSLQGVNSSLKVAQSELKNASAKVGAFGKKSENLKGVQQALASQVELQTKKVDIYRQSLENATTKMNDNIAKRDKLKASLESANKDYDEAVRLHGKESDEAKQAGQAVESLSKDLDKADRAVQTNARSINTYTTNLNNAEAELARTQGALKNANKELATNENKWVSAGKTMEATSKKIKATGDKIGGVGKGLSIGVTAPIMAVGVGLEQLGEKFEKSFNTIRIGTGATGEALKGLEDDFKATLSKTGASMEATSQVIADLNTRTGLSGKSLQDLSLQMLKLSKITGEDLNTLIPATTRMFQDAGISTDKYAEALDYTFKVSQSTGIGVGKLQELMTQFGGPLRQMGFDWQTSATMLGKFEKEGVNTELVVGSLRIALGKMAKEGIKDPSAALQEMITKIKAAGTAGQANALSLSMFGAKAGPDMAAAIREGRMDLDGLLKSLKDSPETIGKAAESTATMADKLAKIKNQMAVAFEPVGTKLIDSLEKLTPTIQKVATSIANMAEKIADMSPEQQEMILKIGLTVAALGPLLSTVGKVISIGGGVVGKVGKIAGALGSVSVAAEGTTAAVGATATGLGGAGAAAGAAALLLNPVTLGIVGVGVAAAGTAYLLNQKVIPAVDLFGNSVSDATKKSVTAYMNMDNKVGTSLLSFKANNATITNAIATDMTTTFEKMGQQIKEGRDKHYTEDLANLKQFYTDQGTINTKDAQDTLAKMQQDHEAKNAQVNSFEAQIKAIYQKAADDHRALTQKEEDEVKAIKDKMQNEAIQALTESEAEQKSILTQMRLQAGNISTLQAADVIKNSAKQRDETVRLANDQYKKTVDSIARQRDEGVITSDDQARKMIDAAKRTRDEAVKHAQNMHTSVVKELENENKDVATKINTQDGTIKSHWNQLIDWFNRNPITRWFNDVNRSSAQSAAADRDRIASHASGTNSFSGGLTTLHEKGYEVYDLPNRTRIYNHEASQDMIMKTAQEVARGVLAGMQSQSQSRESPQPIEINLITDNQVISRQQFVLTKNRAQAMGVRTLNG